MSFVSKELLKNVVNKFITNGHSSDSSYLIVKYFIGLKTNNINHYEEQIKKYSKLHSYIHKPFMYDCKKK